MSLAGRTIGVWQVVENIVIGAGEATQNQDFGIAIPPEIQGIRIDAHIVNDQAAQAVYHIRLNGAAWAGTKQFWATFGAGTSANNTATIGLMTLNAAGGAPEEGQFEIDFNFPQTGIVRVGKAWSTALDLSANKTEMFLTNWDVTTPATSAAIISAGIGNDQASGIGVGSRMRLWFLR